MRAHSMDPVSRLHGIPEYKNGRCTYCNSMTFDEAITLLKTRGTMYAGCEWEFNFPHRFQIGSGYFYTEHLRDCTHEELATWNAIATPLLGIGFVQETEEYEDFFFSAPCPHHVASGVVP